MTDAMGADGVVDWRPIEPASVASPFVRRVPYLELKLEHPSLEPTGYDDRFFPDAVPYALDGHDRVFYWRTALTDGSDLSLPWRVACATTDDLHGFGSLPAIAPSLTDDDEDGTTVVVDGTVAGESTTARLATDTAPTVHIESVETDGVELTVDGRSYDIGAGERRRIECDEQRVTRTTGDGGPATVTPVLVVRYPGSKELHHPAPRAAYRLFPSFGLHIDAIPRPLSVPTVAGDLDHDALATRVGTDLEQRPYAERVLWQAFAFTAFDPHAAGPVEITQLRTGHFAVRAVGDEGPS